MTYFQVVEKISNSTASNVLLIRQQWMPNTRQRSSIAHLLKFSFDVLIFIFIKNIAKSASEISNQSNMPFKYV